MRMKNYIHDTSLDMNVPVRATLWKALILYITLLSEQQQKKSSLYLDLRLEYRVISSNMKNIKTLAALSPSDSLKALTQKKKLKEYSGIHTFSNEKEWGNVKTKTERQDQNKSNGPFQPKPWAHGKRSPSRKWSASTKWLVLVFDCKHGKTFNDMNVSWIRVGKFKKTCNRCASSFILCQAIYHLPVSLLCLIVWNQHKETCGWEVWMEMGYRG